MCQLSNLPSLANHNKFSHLLPVQCLRAGIAGIENRQPQAHPLALLSPNFLQVCCIEAYGERSTFNIQTYVACSRMCKTKPDKFSRHDTGHHLPETDLTPLQLPAKPLSSPGMSISSRACSARPLQCVRQSIGGLRKLAKS